VATGDIINATTASHGPSWRMIVQLTKNTEAYGVYPGGQSGNPGSKYYDDFVGTWTKGSILFLMDNEENGDRRCKGEVEDEFWGEMMRNL
jgi:penicillin amidase